MWEMRVLQGEPLQRAVSLHKLQYEGVPRPSELLEQQLVVGPSIDGGLNDRTVRPWHDPRRKVRV